MCCKNKTVLDYGEYTESTCKKIKKEVNITRIFTNTTETISEYLS